MSVKILSVSVLLLTKVYKRVSDQAHKPDIYVPPTPTTLLVERAEEGKYSLQKLTKTKLFDGKNMYNNINKGHLFQINSTITFIGCGVVSDIPCTPNCDVYPPELGRLVIKELMSIKLKLNRNEDRTA